MSRLVAQLISYPPGYRMAPHTDGCRRLSILVSGDMRESDGRQVERPRVGSVALKASGFVHQDRFGASGTTILSVVLPDTIVGKLGQDPFELKPWFWHHVGSTSTAGLRLASGLAAGDEARVEETLRRVLREFVNRPGRSCARTRRVRSFLEAGCTQESVQVAKLARKEGVHPGALNRLFRRHVGCSITRYRQRVRVHSVAHDLVESRDELVQIALKHGFADSSHLNRVFRAEIGTSPGQFRRQMLGLVHAAADEAEARFESFKTEWYLNL